MKHNIFQHAVRSFSISGLLALAVVFFLPSCKNREKVTEDTFQITPRTIRAHSATFEVAPITNEFYYEADALTLAQYNQLGEKGIVEMTVQYFDSLKNALEKQHISYNNDYLYYKGLYDCSTTEYLPANTPCVFYAIRLHSKTLEPILPIITYPFTTKEEVSRDMTIDFKMDGSTLYYEPSDTFPYICDYISKEDLVKSYSNDPNYFAQSIIAMYEKYDFITSVLAQGPVIEDVLDWYPDLQPGDSIYAIAVGYEQNDFTTKIFSKSFAIK